jgi:hypothetical protein
MKAIDTNKNTRPLLHVTGTTIDNLKEIARSVLAHYKQNNQICFERKRVEGNAPCLMRICFIGLMTNDNRVK